MQKEEFKANLERASAAAVALAGKFVKNQLHGKPMYVRRGAAAPLPPDELVELLWQDGRVPVWVDLSVESANPETTYIRVESGRFADDDSRLRYQQLGFPPFQPVGPDMPPGWRPGSSERIDINWRKTKA